VQFPPLPRLPTSPRLRRTRRRAGRVMYQEMKLIPFLLINFMYANFPAHLPPTLKLPTPPRLRRTRRRTRRVFKSPLISSVRHSAAKTDVSRDEAACAKCLKNICYNYSLCADSSLDTILASLESLEMIGFFLIKNTHRIHRPLRHSLDKSGLPLKYLKSFFHD